MKAFEFVSTLRSKDAISIPAHVAGQLRADQPFRVVLLVSEEDEDADWAGLTTEQFLKGYDESDSIYDQLPSG